MSYTPHFSNRISTQFPRRSNNDENPLVVQRNLRAISPLPAYRQVGLSGQVVVLVSSLETGTQELAERAKTRQFFTGSS